MSDCAPAAIILVTSWIIQIARQSLTSVNANVSTKSNIAGLDGALSMSTIIATMAMIVKSAKHSVVWCKVVHTSWLRRGRSRSGLRRCELQFPKTSVDIVKENPNKDPAIVADVL